MKKQPSRYNGEFVAFVVEGEPTAGATPARSTMMKTRHMGGTVCLGQMGKEVR